MRILQELAEARRRRWMKPPWVGAKIKWEGKLQSNFASTCLLMMCP